MGRLDKQNPLKVVQSTTGLLVQIAPGLWMVGCWECFCGCGMYTWTLITATADHCQKLVTRLDRPLVCSSIICYHTFPTQNHALPFFSKDCRFHCYDMQTLMHQSPWSLPQGMAHHTQSHNQSILLGIKPYFCANFCSSVCPLKDKASQPLYAMS